MRGILLALAAASATACPGAACAAADLSKLTAATDAMKQLNVLTFNNAALATDIEGKAWIGGDATGGGVTVGLGSASGTARSSGYATLTVGGTLDGGDVHLNYGTNGSPGTYGLTVGRNLSSSVDFNGGVATSVSIGGAVTAAKGLNTSSSATGSTINVGGGVTAITAGSGATVRTGGSVAAMSLGTGSLAYVNGDLGTGSSFDISAGSKVYVAGQEKSQSQNGIGGGGGMWSNGARWSGAMNSPGAGYAFNQNTDFSKNAPVTVDVAQQRSDFVDQLAYLSTGIRSLGTDKEITARTVLTAADYGSKGYAVFNVADAASFFAAGNDLKSIFAAAPSKTVLINVAGMTINDLANFNDPGGTTNIIWNFYQATSVTLGNFYGSVLAPNASVTKNSSGFIAGSVVAASFTQQGEVHLGTFAGDTSFLNAITIPDPAGAVPEPASWAMMVIGFGVIGGAIRRHRRCGDHMPAIRT